MSDPTAVLVAERDDALRDELIGQLSADAFEPEPARSVAEVRCRAARAPDLLLLGELEHRLAALRLLRAIRAGDALAGRTDPALPVIVLSGEEGDWVALRAFEAGCDATQLHRRAKVSRSSLVLRPLGAAAQIRPERQSPGSRVQQRGPRAGLGRARRRPGARPTRDARGQGVAGVGRWIE